MRSTIDGQMPSSAMDSTSASGCEQGLRESWERCESLYGLNPFSRLLGNRFSQSEVNVRLERVQEPLWHAEPMLHRIREVVRQAEYCMLIADSDGAAVAEYSDSAKARELKTQGISIGTLWDEPCVGTNGIGTALASKSAITVNGKHHYHSNFHKFMCSAAPLLDHKGERIGAINLTGTATEDEAELARVSRYVSLSATNLHTFVFRSFFKHHMMLAIAESPLCEAGELSRLLALDENGRVAGVTNDLMNFLGVADRQALIGTPVDQIVGLDLDALFSTKSCLHPLGEGALSGRYAVSIPIEPRARQGGGKSDSRGSTASASANESLGLDAMAGRDARMKKMVGLCRRMVGSRSEEACIPILLQGETGTGKDTFARALHLESRRSQQAFVALNCAAIPEGLIDSELFGYAPGTFTGGLKDGKPGHVIAANGGTLFLDEIGDMPIDSQTRLLRVLAERKVQPLGGSRAVSVDFQLICASHRNLIDLVHEGQFREDLYYRVCGAKVTLPALRERQDIERIAKGLLSRHDTENSITFSDTLWERLRQFSWPGNIRQLHNVIQYIVFSCEGGQATLDDLPEDLKAENGHASALVSDGVSAPAFLPQNAMRQLSAAGATSSTRPTLYQSRRDELIDALHHARWCVSEAARHLGISRATVHRQMKKYGIVRPDHQAI